MNLCSLVHAVCRPSGVSFTASIISGYDVLVNEDKTRSFVCLRVRGGRQMVLKLIAKVDPLMRRFKQAAYYEVIRRTHLVTVQYDLSVRFFLYEILLRLHAACPRGRRHPAPPLITFEPTLFCIQDGNQAR